MNLILVLLKKLAELIVFRAELLYRRGISRIVRCEVGRIALAVQHFKVQPFNRAFLRPRRAKGKRLFEKSEHIPRKGGILLKANGINKRTEAPAVPAARFKLR